MKFFNSLTKNKEKVLVIGLGYVGISLIKSLSESKQFQVNGFDTSSEVIRQISKNSGYYKGANLKNVKLSTLSLTSDQSELNEYDVFIICVPTPLLNGGPDLSMVNEAAQLVSKLIKKGNLVILESTSYPGTTENVLLPILEESKLIGGQDFFLAFASERIDPGNEKYGIKNTPKVVGGLNSISTNKASKFYENFVDKVVTAKGTREAELSKLLENTYRIVNIALVNELAMVCSALEIDIWDTIRCASSKPFGFQTFYPGPGVGGHCIPIDPIYLSQFVNEKLNKDFELVNLSQKINTGMSEFVFNRIAQILNKSGMDLSQANILVIGAAYKNDVSDTRESPIFPIIELLVKNKINFTIHDHYVDKIKVHDKSYVIEKILPENLNQFDLILILQHHKNLDTKSIIKSAVKVLDTRGKIKIRENYNDFSNLNANIFSL